MANLKLKNPAGGSLNLVSADGASDLTATIPALTGTLLSSAGGTTPAFFAYPPASNQSLTNDTWTKVTLSNTSWNVGTTYGYSTANSRFTAPVAGYYYFAGSAFFASSTNMTAARLALYVSGSPGFYGPFTPISTTDVITTVTGMFQLAASDYIELYGYTTGGTGQVIAQYSSYTYLQGMFVRGNAT